LQSLFRSRQISPIFRLFCTFRDTKTDKNQKKPVETTKTPLTFRRKTPKVNFGTFVGPA